MSTINDIWSPSLLMMFLSRINLEDQLPWLLVSKITHRIVISNLESMPELDCRAITKNGSDFKATMQFCNESQKTAKLLISCFNRPSLLKFFLSQGADPNQNEPISSITPLHAAASLGHQVALSILLQYKAYPDLAFIHTEFTALHFAAKAKSVACICTLLEYKADLNARDLLGRTPLYLATVEQSVECVRILLAYQADPNLPDLVNRTPLNTALQLENVELISLLNLPQT